MPKQIQWRQTPLPNGWTRLQGLLPKGTQLQPVEVLYHSQQRKLYWQGHTYALPPPSAHPEQCLTHENQEKKDIRAMMSGWVSEITVHEGEQVQPGDLLCILEAMKMRLEVTASQNAQIAKILIQPQETVQVGQLILQLETEQALDARSDEISL